MKQVLLITLLTLGFGGAAQTLKKEFNAVKAITPPVIDGKLDDEAWVSANIASDFIMLEPGNGEPEPSGQNSRIRIVYDDQAIYVGAMLYDHHPDSILKQVTARDNFNNNNDWFGIFINPYNDGLSDFNFWVTAAGVQADSRTTINGDDFGWNVVWESAVDITDQGWTCEIAIPYMALRFPETPKGQWGLNMIRSIRRNRTQYSWNLIDKSSGFPAEYQCGLLKGMEDISPPIRLSLTPYASGYVNDFDGTTTYDFNAGLDLKYGINEGFTLDMTLIPDFGQVAFDVQVLNLSPFENRFQENRQFFTEGTDLFGIGGLFYSRRIGGTPKNITGNSVQDSNFVQERQEFTRLLNATKISGRTKGNLGIGFLNAVTDNNYTLFKNNETGEEERVLIEPFTNYNVLVLDQRFNRKSSVSFINTNVWREGVSEDANVTGLLGSFFNNAGTHAANTSFKMSTIIDSTGSSSGFEAGLSLRDVGGNWRWSIDENITSDLYDINDLGFQTRNNRLSHFGSFGYRIFNPVGRFNQINLNVTARHQSLYKPNLYESFSFGFNSFFLLRSFFGFAADISFEPVDIYDYFEPREAGRFFRLPGGFSTGGFISTDYRKPFAIDLRFRYNHRGGFAADQYNFNVQPRIRVNDHLFMILQSTYNLNNNNYGWVATSDENDIYFGRRHIKRLTNSADVRYVFNPYSSLTLNLNHTWTRVEYQSYSTLQLDGRLRASDFDGVPDINFNTLNLDLRYTWWFAPASQFVLLYRNVIFASGSVALSNYFENLDVLFSSPAQNNLSLRLTYFLDYHTIKQRLRS